MMTIVLFAILALFAVYVLSPFFSEQFRRKHLTEDGSELENLYFKKDEVLAAIEDLKYDYQMKKISEADYLQMKEKLSQEAVELMKRIDQSEGADAAVRAKSGNRKANAVGS